MRDLWFFMKTYKQFLTNLKPTTMRIFWLLLSLLSLAACEFRPGANNQTLYPTNSTQVIYQYLTAELLGKLVMVNQCLRINGDDGVNYLLVWPSDFSVRIEGDTLHITQGVVTGDRKDYDLHIGDRIDIGGGTVDKVDTSSFRVSRNNCPGPYWAFYGLAKK